jgi:desulfoferrodoxin (superoxide reductase-like protein)
MAKVLGGNLPLNLQAEAKRAFPHRFTGDHRPQWVLAGMPNGEAYPLQFTDDRDWLGNTYFEVTKAGKLSARSRYCESHPTWPNNPELRKH